MPPMRSVEVDALGKQRLGAGEGKQTAGQRGGARRAFHRIVEVHHHLAPGTVEAAEREVDPADDDGEHVVEVVRDAAGELADRLHLLHLAKLGLGGLALGCFGLERPIGLPQLLGAVANRASRDSRRVRPSSSASFRAQHVLAERRDRDDGEEDGAEADRGCRGSSGRW